MSFVRNYQIESILSEWKKESKATRSIHYWYSNGILTICSSEVGLLIGKFGELVFKYETQYLTKVPGFQKVQFQEVNKHWI